MLERRVVRLLTVASPVHYFVDGAEQGGIVYEAARLFENQLNTDAGTKTLRVHVIVVPVPRDQLIPALLDGRGDVAGGNLTITPERTQQVDFSRPSARDVSEIVVTGPGAPALGAVEDLSGREVFVQPSSGYAESLRGLNAELVAASRKPVEVIAVDEHLEDGDVLEMVQAGLYPITVVDDHMARLWKQLLPGIELHETLAVRRGRELGWAMRKGNPQLKAAVDRFLSSHGQGTRLGNILINRYLANPARLRDPRGKAELARFRDTADTFRKYADRYRFDWLMIMAQAYQESQLDHSKRSPSGAMGIMQIKPSTARDPSVGIAEVSDLDSNVHAGVKYLRVIADSYFADPEVDDRNAMLFAIASYNAGPARIARLRAETPAAGLDPNRWFGNVEVVASRRVGRETVQYVGNIFKYYLAYRMVSERTEKATAARDTPQR
jgi:membrane-bound lytic murein transglycosylase MltF